MFCKEHVTETSDNLLFVSVRLLCLLFFSEQLHIQKTSLKAKVVSVVVVKPFLSLCFAFIFVRAILCLKLNIAAVLVRGGGAGVRVCVKNC